MQYARRRDLTMDIQCYSKLKSRLNCVKFTSTFKKDVTNEKYLRHSEIKPTLQIEMSVRVDVMQDRSASGPACSASFEPFGLLAQSAITL